MVALSARATFSAVLLRPQLRVVELKCRTKFEARA